MTKSDALLTSLDGNQERVNVPAERESVGVAVVDFIERAGIIIARLAACGFLAAIIAHQEGWMFWTGAAAIVALILTSYRMVQLAHQGRWL